MIYCFDLDGTLCNLVVTSDYEKAQPFPEAIAEVNRLYDNNHTIQIFTARGAVSKIDHTELTTHQLKSWGLKYHELILNRKPHYDILIDDKAQNAFEWHKTLPKRTGLIAGCFDLIHPGYIKIFKDAKNVCNWLVVALHNDPSIDRPIKDTPIHSLAERKEILSSIKYIDEIVFYQTEQDLDSLLKAVNVDIRILSSEYQNTQYTGHDLGIPVYYHDRNHDYSATNLRNKIRCKL